MDIQACVTSEIKLAVGPKLYEQMNIRAYVQQIAEFNSQTSSKFIELLSNSTHPMTINRIQAILRFYRSGRLLGARERRPRGRGAGERLLGLRRCPAYPPTALKTEVPLFVLRSALGTFDRHGENPLVGIDGRRKKHFIHYCSNISTYGTRNPLVLMKERDFVREHTCGKLERVMPATEDTRTRGYYRCPTRSTPRPSRT
jgi:hypothetical protein